VIREEAPFLDDGRHALRNRRLPAAIAALQASQHVAGIDPKNRWLVVLEGLDVPIVAEAKRPSL